jgi:CheY-like chemotaxis protein
MPSKRILLVDDDEVLRSTLREILKSEGYDVTTAADVPEALKYITSNVYDVLLSDLHMPGAGDGLTVVSAMRHSNPKAVTIILSAFPEMDAASRAILQQTDQILVKPTEISELMLAIKEILASGSPPVHAVETVATILERTVSSTIADWYALVETEEKIMAVPMTREQRVDHLPQLFIELVQRLRSFKAIGSKEIVSESSQNHGIKRRRQGYSAAMLVEESRMLQVSIFNTLQKNLAHIDFSILLTEVMTIADEIDSQLSQAMTSYIAEPLGEPVPA